MASGGISGMRIRFPSTSNFISKSKILSCAAQTSADVKGKAVRHKMTGCRRQRMECRSRQVRSKLTLTFESGSDGMAAVVRLDGDDVVVSRVLEHFSNDGEVNFQRYISVTPVALETTCPDEERHERHTPGIHDPKLESVFVAEKIGNIAKIIISGKLVSVTKSLISSNAFFSRLPCTSRNSNISTAFQNTEATESETPPSEACDTRPGGSMS